MKKIYISSYYQSKSMGYVLTDGNKEELKGIFDATGAILVSHETMEKANKIMLSQGYSSSYLDYLTALFCDIEVAIQERNLIAMAKQLGFEHELCPTCMVPSFTYLEESSISSLNLKPEETHDDEVFVINTHGREQELDGPYQNAIYNSLNHIRIVVDACSSASGSFPVKHSGNKSAIQMVADESIKAFKNNQERFNNLQIVGYYNKFTTNEINLTACAIFAPKEMISDHTDLALITPAERARQIKRLESRAEEDSVSKKLRSYSSDLTDLNASSRTVLELRTILIEMCSKITSHFVYKKRIKDASNDIIDLLCQHFAKHSSLSMTFKEHIEHIANKGGKPLEIFKNELKEDRKTAFEKMTREELTSEAEKVIGIAQKLTDPDLSKDFIQSMKTLELAISNMKISTPQKHRFFSSIDENNNRTSSPGTSREDSSSTSTSPEGFDLGSTSPR